MTYSDTGLNLTERAEALRLTAYADQGGVWTIGYGHTGGVFQNMVITRDQAAAFLEKDIQVSVRCVNGCVNVPLTQNQFDSLVDFTFNVGTTAFVRSGLLRAVNQGNMAQAEAEFRKWVFVKGTVNRGLYNRRTAEIAEFAGEGA